VRNEAIRTAIQPESDLEREGVEAAQREYPALILCDVMMPALDGHGDIAALR